ncbi:hypothetical protein BASA50_004266 [Batrachochytrium salamandrivorans]|uniref:Uncharacterized protein n=1 Tax=Batrachochytrium salamandrivorans TaxID=1357716 RepID=A0ABQ8FFW0_9FUNG|nr:hypothetical protein BASA60_000418 [Batrachochytrium salamandrivorans]KAH6597660.1 hypothetical protein BASA50_004266 [Batrachochytrium salamandrivorans]KAH6602009.1 hypothetical protein BASA61_001562 [Batrachochytrium salamandrivorans]KAH9271776.1 hypothetical protein BASA83_005876 [Batrachochytrium salamandrivorans]
MQFFCLLSFAVVALHAAALPQPAGLSEKYSNSADTNLASGLEARSYQPALNPQQDSVTSMLLKRQDDFEGYSEDDGESDPSSPPVPTSDGIVRKIDGAFKVEIGSLDLSSTIDEIGDYRGNLPKSIEAVGEAIDGIVGDMVVEYIKRTLYVNELLKDWIASNGETVIPILKSGLDDAEYSRVELSLRKTAARLIDEVRACLIAAFDALSNIIEKTGDVAQNVETVAKSFERVFNSRMEFFEKLKLSLEKFEAGEGFRTLLSNIGESINRFMGKQRKLHGKIMEALIASPLTS